MLFSLYPLSLEFYLNPGSGNVLIQMMIASLLGEGVITRSQWSRIKKWFSSNADGTSKEDDGEENGDY